MAFGCSRRPSCCSLPVHTGPVTALHWCIIATLVTTGLCSFAEAHFCGDPVRWQLPFFPTPGALVGKHTFRVGGGGVGQTVCLQTLGRSSRSSSQGSFRREFPQNLGGSDTCHFCGKRVYVMERLSAEGRFFHRECFRCHTCGSTLRLGGHVFDSDQGRPRPLPDSAVTRLESFKVNVPTGSLVGLTTAKCVPTCMCPCILLWMRLRHTLNSI